MDKDQTESANAPNLVARPYEIIQSLPPRYRWEFTRRHPYYVMCWNNVDPDVAPSSSEHPGENELRLRMAQFAKLALYTIGFAGTPVAPESDWGELDSDALAGIWTKGALARVRLGALAAMLVKILPREAKKEFAAAFNVSAALDTVDDNRAKAQKEFELCEFLTHGALPFGDSYLPELLVTLNPTASRRDATQAIVEILDEFKRINGIPDQRTQEKKLDTYLAAWDRREGWVGGEYRADLEMPLEGAAADLGLSTSTVHSQYCQAFKLITGQKYDAFLWFRLLGMFKISQHVGCGYPHISSQRPKSARQTRGGREVSEATFGVTTEEISSSDHGMLGAYNESDLLLDVQALVEEGASREDIVRRLGIPDHATQALDYLLDRMNS